MIQTQVFFTGDDSNSGIFTGYMVGVGGNGVKNKTYFQILLATLF